MPNLFVNNGQTATTTQAPGAASQVLVAQGGSILVPSSIGSSPVAIHLQIGSTAYVAGEVTSVGNAAIDFLGPENSAFANIMITPTGRITSFGLSPAISIDTASSFNSSLRITNYGFIGADSTAFSAIALWNGNDTVTNIGTIAGNVSLNGGNDLFTQLGGVVLGMVDAGSGDDLLDVQGLSAGARSLRFDGSTGMDTATFSSFGAAIWLDLDYAGTNAWTRDSLDLSTGAWRQIALLQNMEVIQGSGLSDYLSGNDLDNTFLYSGGIDTISGDGGRDTYDASGLGFAVWVDLAYAGYEVFTQRSASITANGNWMAIADLTSVESIVGTSKNDQVWGNTADNRYLFTGVDFASGPKLDTFDGRGGADTADFSRSPYGAVWVSLAYPGVEAWTSMGSTVTTTLTPILDLVSVENLTGTSFEDYLAGNSGNNELWGRAGADTLVGLGGADTFIFDVSLTGLAEFPGMDTINDFAPGTDKVGIRGYSVMPDILIGTAPTANSPAPTLYYNTSSGDLTIDPDGTGGSLSLFFVAHLVGTPVLTASDFILA